MGFSLGSVIGSVGNIANGLLDFGSQTTSTEKAKSSKTGKTDSNQVFNTLTEYLTGGQQTQLDQLLTMLLGSALTPDKTTFSKDAAIHDSQGAIADIFRQFQQLVIPQNANAQNQSGGYNSTAVNQLNSQGYSDAVSKAGALVLDTINKYATLGQNQQQLDINSILNAFQIARGATEKKTGNIKTTGTSQETGTGINSTVGTDQNRGFIGQGYTGFLNLLTGGGKSGGTT